MRTKLVLFLQFILIVLVLVEAPSGAILAFLGAFSFCMQSYVKIGFVFLDDWKLKFFFNNSLPRYSQNTASGRKNQYFCIFSVVFPKILKFFDANIFKPW